MLLSIYDRKQAGWFLFSAKLVPFSGNNISELDVSLTVLHFTHITIGMPTTDLLGVSLPQKAKTNKVRRSFFFLVCVCVCVCVFWIVATPQWRRILPEMRTEFFISVRIGSAVWSKWCIRDSPRGSIRVDDAKMKNFEYLSILRGSRSAEDIFKNNPLRSPEHLIRLIWKNMRNHSVFFQQQY